MRILPSCGLSVLLVLAPFMPVNPLLAKAPQVNDFEVTLFGRPWRVVSYFVQDDLQRNQNEDTFLEPEGLAFKNGLLYVSGDRDPVGETSSRLAVYNCVAGGTLTYNTYIQMPSSSPNWWGPEGLTFNNSGSGYGSGSNQLVSVERDDTGQAGIITLSNGNTSSKLSLATPEDITFLPATGQFATLTDQGSSIALTFYDASMSPTGASLPVAPGSNGLVGVSASFGSWFTQVPQATEVFIVVTKANPGNAVLAYDQAGSQIWSQWNLPLLPKARIDLGGGWYELRDAFKTVEAVTVDETNKVLFLGDEANSMVHVLTPRVAADFDNDTDVDGFDFLTFSNCYNGSNRPALAACTDGHADMDVDGDVDGFDFLTFSNCFNGSNRPPLCP
jgi:hypothetical protein